MKKYFLFFCALCASAVAFGQVEVQSNGQLTINRSVWGTTNTSYGVHSTVTHGGSSSPYGDCVGVYGYADNSPSTTNFPARFVGVLGTAHSASSSTKARIGVAGLASYHIGSVGIYGGTYTSGLPSLTFTTTYAGYFAGLVYVTSTVDATGYLTHSDERLKRNIVPIVRDDVTVKLSSLNPVKYYLKQIETENDSINANGETVSFTTKRYDENSQEFQKMHYGLLAQELQQVYPELVYDSGDGYLSVNYVELIPLLLQAFQTQQATIQQQQIEIDMLKSNNTPFSQNNAPAKPQQEAINEPATLFQNTPNPFNENTEIAFYLPQSVNNAMLCVYDMNGKQLSQNIITQRGSSVFVVNGNEYGAGMYLYSLIVDNQIIDTKRMILTK